MAIAALPKELQKASFEKSLKALGVLKISVPNPKKIILSVTESGKAPRRAILKDVAKVLTSLSAKFVDDGGSGYVLISTGVRILCKPEKFASGLVLKPGRISSALCNVEIPYANYRKILIDAIENHKELTEPQKVLLLAITQYHLTFSPKDLAAMKKAIKDVGNSIPFNTINNDYGEVLGPLAVIGKGLLPIDAKSAKVFIPGRSNEPLIDYKIIDKNGPWPISAKSGDSTNTLKPGDVRNLIEEDKTLSKKWKSKPQFAVIKDLSDNGWKEGPLIAGMNLKNKGVARFNWIKNVVYTPETRQRAENDLVAFSRTEMDFTPIYIDATNAKVHYVKFRIGQDGSVEWKIVDHSKEEADKPKKRVTFRSKNSVSRDPKGDKLGFQV